MATHHQDLIPDFATLSFFREACMRQLMYVERIKAELE